MVRTWSATVVTGMPSSRAMPVSVIGPISNTTLYAAYSSGRRPASCMAASTSARVRWPRTNTSNRSEVCRSGRCRQPKAASAIVLRHPAHPPTVTVRSI